MMLDVKHAKVGLVGYSTFSGIHFYRQRNFFKVLIFEDLSLLLVASVTW